jgi:hypothetical protein
MYKLILNNLTNQQCAVLNKITNTFIPFDPANTDYQAYLKWVEAGNQPLPADE